MKSLLRLSIWMFVCLLFWAMISIEVFAQTGEIVVAIRQLKMKSSTEFSKMPVESQPAERWEVVKRHKRKVELTFGPNDERRKIWQQAGKVFKHEVSMKEFNAHFVSETEWATRRLRLAVALQMRFPELTIEQCIKVWEYEYWIGMPQEVAGWIVGNRIIVREDTETASGIAEVWKVAAFSVDTDPARGKEGIFISAPVERLRIHAPGKVKLSRDMEQAISVELTFREGVLTDITHR